MLAAQDRDRSCFYYLGIGPGIATTVIDVNVSTDDRFYALGIGLGFAAKGFTAWLVRFEWFSMPSVSGWALRRGCSTRPSSPLSSFYALDIGLGFATFRW